MRLPCSVAASLGVVAAACASLDGLSGSVAGGEDAGQPADADADADAEANADAPAGPAADDLDAGDAGCLTARIGPLSPTAATNFGPGNPWSDPQNALVKDSIYSYGNSPTALLVVHGFGFTVPAASRIVRVTVGVTRGASAAGQVADARVVLVAGSLTSDSYATTITWPNAETHSYPSVASTWGLTLTGADVDTSDFGVGISAKRVSGNGALQFWIDAVVMTIVYCK